MPLNIEYDSYDELKMRLEGTILTYDGEPVYVTNVTPERADGKSRINIKPLPLDKNERYGNKGDDEDNDDKPNKPGLRKIINSPKLNLEPFQLGYCNVGEGNVVWMSRIPVRKFKQGLNGANLSLTSPADSQAGRTSFDNLIYTQEFADALKNKYPTLEGSIGHLTKRDSRGYRAFARDFCLTYFPLGYFTLEYQNEAIGFSESGRKFKIPKKFHYLGEVLRKNNVEFYNG